MEKDQGVRVNYFIRKGNIGQGEQMSLESGYGKSLNQLVTERLLQMVEGRGRRIYHPLLRDKEGMETEKSLVNAENTA